MLAQVCALRDAGCNPTFHAMTGPRMQPMVLCFAPPLTRRPLRAKAVRRKLGASAILGSGQRDNDDLGCAAAPTFAAHHVARFQAEYRTRGWVEIPDFVPGSSLPATCLLNSLLSPAASKCAQVLAPLLRRHAGGFTC